MLLFGEEPALPAEICVAWVDGAGLLEDTVIGVTISTNCRSIPIATRFEFLSSLILCLGLPFARLPSLTQLFIKLGANVSAGQHRSQTVK